MSLYIVLITAVIVTRNYGKERLPTFERKEDPLHVLYPLGVWIADHIGKEKREKVEKRKEMLRSITITCDVKKLYVHYQAKKYASIIMVIMVVNTVALFMLLLGNEESKLLEGQYLIRPETTSSDETVNLHVKLEGEDTTYENDVEVPVNARKYAREEYEKVVNSSKEQLKILVLGENRSLDMVNKPLNLSSSIEGTALEIDWDINSEVVRQDGTIDYTLVPEKGVDVKLIALLKYQIYETKYEIAIRVYPQKFTKEELLEKKIEYAIAVSNEKNGESERLILPKEIESQPVKFTEPKKETSYQFLTLGLFLAILLGAALDSQIEKKCRKRTQQVMLDYPELINKFVLLLGAGMTVKRAWEKIVLEYEEKRKRNLIDMRYAYEEMRVTYHELCNGTNEVYAYERYGHRIKEIPYIKLASLLGQNVTKGLRGVLDSLEHEASIALQQRKEVAKRLGEEAATKLLLPMGMMLLIVLVMIMVPALSSLK